MMAGELGKGVVLPCLLSNKMIKLHLLQRRVGQMLDELVLL